MLAFSPHQKLVSFPSSIPLKVNLFKKRKNIHELSTGTISRKRANISVSLCRRTHSQCGWVYTAVKPLHKPAKTKPNHGWQQIGPTGERCFFYINFLKRDLFFVPLCLQESSLWRKEATRHEPPCRGEKISAVLLGSPPGFSHPCGSLQWGFCRQQPQKQMDWMAGSAYLWLPDSPLGIPRPPATWPVTSDPGPVANTGVQRWGM